MNSTLIPTYPLTGLCSEPTTETHLVTFIRWALRVTANGEYSGDAAIALLERAWDAQQQLWQLRQGQATEDSE